MKKLFGLMFVFMSFFGLFNVSKASTIVGFDFNDSTKTGAITNNATWNKPGYSADYGIVGNINSSKIITFGSTFSAWDTGPELISIPASSPSLVDRDNGSGTKYWFTKFSTLGYTGLQLSSKQYSSNTGPRDFIVQYSTGGVIWFDVGFPIVVENNFSGGVVNNLPLPSVLSNQSNIYLRWIMTSNTSVSSGVIATGGTSRIDDIIVLGDPIIVLGDPIYTLTYDAGLNGAIVGSGLQTVISGGNGTIINAVANTGYKFLNRSDGSTTNPRTDIGVTGNITLTANFIPIIDIVLSKSLVNKGMILSGDVVTYQFSLTNTSTSHVFDFNTHAGSVFDIVDDIVLLPGNPGDIIPTSSSGVKCYNLGNVIQASPFVGSWILQHADTNVFNCDIIDTVLGTGEEFTFTIDLVANSDFLTGVTNRAAFYDEDELDPDSESLFQAAQKSDDVFALSNNNISIAVFSLSDTVAPISPLTAPVLQSGFDFGISNNDGITNLIPVIFDVICTETGSTITLYSNANVSGTGICTNIGVIPIATFAPPSAPLGSFDGIYNITYTETDGMNNESLPSPQAVLILDTLPPIVLLSGSSFLTGQVGTIYTEYGATWNDGLNGTGIVLSPFSGTVNYNIPGIYNVEYTYIDIAGNTGNVVTRTIEIVPISAMKNGGTASSINALKVMKLINSLTLLPPVEKDKNYENSIIEQEDKAFKEEGVILTEEDKKRIFNPSFTQSCFDYSDKRTIKNLGVQVSETFLDAHQLFYSYSLTKRQGTKDYRPFDTITREEAAGFFLNFAQKVLCRNPNTTYTAQFSDLEGADDTLEPFIKASYEFGIFHGDGGSTLSADQPRTFRPKEVMTQNELAAVIVRLVTNEYDETGGEDRSNAYKQFLNNYAKTRLQSSERANIAEVVYEVYRLNKFVHKDIGYVIKR